MHWSWRVAIALAMASGFQMSYWNWSCRTRLRDWVYESVFGGNVRNVEQGLPSMVSVGVGMLPVLIVAFSVYGMLSLVWARQTTVSGETRKPKGSLRSRIVNEVHYVILAILALVATAGLFIGVVSFARPVNYRWNEYRSQFRLEHGVIEYYSQSWSGWTKRRIRIPRVIWYQAGVNSVRVSIALWTVFVLCAAYPVIATIRGLRPRRRETRCRKCGYILRGISEPRCPQCGERI